MREDLQNLIDRGGFLHWKIIETADGDYLWRVILDLEEVTDALFALSQSIDYDNVKERIHQLPGQADKANAYSRPWYGLHQVQQEDGAAPGLRIRGRVLREAILTGIGLMCDEGLSRFLHASLTQPCSAATYRAIADQPLETLVAAHILELRMTKQGGGAHTAPIRNFAYGLSREDVKSFLAFARGKRCMSLVVLGVIRRISAQEAFGSLESILYDWWPPVLVAVCGGRFGAALATSIDLGIPEWTWISSKFDPSQKHRRTHKKLTKNLTSEVRGHLRQRDGPAAKRSIESFIASGNKSERFVEKFTAQCVWTIMQQPGLSVQASERYLKSVERAISMLARGNTDQANSADEQAIRYIQPLFENVDVNQRSLLIKFFPKVVKTSIPTMFALKLPQELAIRLCYPPGQRCQSKNTNERSARILSDILVENGRRAACLQNIRLGDIHCVRDKVTRAYCISIDIRESKTIASKRNSLSVDWLWPSVSIEHLVDFMETTADFDRGTLLAELAGIERPLNMNEEAFQEALKLVLGSGGTDGFGTHDPRKMWATYWPIRVLCARHPQLLEHALMVKVREHYWFQLEALMRLRRGLNSDCDDAMEIGRRIMGHADTVELLSSYCASWPVLADLHRFLVEALEPRLSQCQRRAGDGVAGVEQRDRSQGSP